MVKEDITLSKINLSTMNKLAMKLLFMKLVMKNIKNVMIFTISIRLLMKF